MPIAHRLGISKIKVELDDLSLKYLEPEVYYELVEKIALRKSEREQFVQCIVKDVREQMDKPVSKRRSTAGQSISSAFTKDGQPGKRPWIRSMTSLRSDHCGYGKGLLCGLGIIHEMYKPIQDVLRLYHLCPNRNLYDLFIPH